jgi:tetratricopeptide (TPR) repeat protein
LLLLEAGGSAFAEAGRWPDITAAPDRGMDWDTAYAAQTRGDLDQAILFYDRAIHAGGLSTWRAAALLTDRGIAYSDKKLFDRAIADFDAALKIDTDHALAFANRAIAYHRKNDYDRAIADYDEAIRLDTEDPDTYRNRGLAFYRKGKYERTIEDDDRAIKLRPDFAEAYYDRGRAHYKLDDNSEALADFSAVIRIEKDSADAFAWRAFVHDDRKEYDLAVVD